MILISHRGNISGRVFEKENKPEYIDQAIALGYEVEIDIRKIYGSLWLGHDAAQYEITVEWLTKRFNKLWIHTKNFQALCHLIDLPLRVFYHEKEQHTIIHGTNLIWSHNISEANYKSVIPLLSEKDVEGNKSMINRVYGVCSDYVSILQ